MGLKLQRWVLGLWLIKQLNVRLFSLTLLLISDSLTDSVSISITFFPRCSRSISLHSWAWKITVQYVRSYIYSDMFIHSWGPTTTLFIHGSSYGFLIKLTFISSSFFFITFCISSCFFFRMLWACCSCSHSWTFLMRFWRQNITLSGQNVRFYPKMILWHVGNHCLLWGISHSPSHWS